MNFKGFMILLTQKREYYYIMDKKKFFLLSTYQYFFFYVKWEKWVVGVVYEWTRFKINIQDEVITIQV